ncbi:MAG: DUF2357 domain-containing protein [Chloroflexi bacterium]|nr:DUF2357 domain-containing protein [Chloroflexota bacterium]
MDLSLSSNPNFRFLETKGQPIAGPVEWMPALIEILGRAGDWEGLQLCCQGQELSLYSKKVQGTKRVLADWPRSGPGHYQLELKLEDQTKEKLIVTILPSKISQESYHQLLEDLENKLPTAIALNLQRMGALAQIKFLPPAKNTLGQEIARLKRAIRGSSKRPGLVTILNELAPNPHQILKAKEPWVRYEQARRPHPARLTQVLSRGYDLDSKGLPQHVIDTRVEHNVDVYENRLVNIFFEQVNRRLIRLLHLLRSKIPLEKLQVGLVTELESLSVELRRARQQAIFLDQVTLPSFVPTQLTMVLLKRPPYRAALEGYLEFHRNVTVRLEEPALDAPLKNLPHLYQLWGTLKVIQMLLEVGAELGYQETKQQLLKRDASGFYLDTLPQNEPVIVLTHPKSGIIVKLIPERSYGKQSTLRSISFEQRPDISLEIKRPNSTSLQVYLFDPKYKLDGDYLEKDEDGSPSGQPKKIDIDKMHAYRDAIRDLQGERVVRYAAILYPGSLISYADDLEALTAYPSKEVALENRLREILFSAIKPI